MSSTTKVTCHFCYLVGCSSNITSSFLKAMASPMKVIRHVGNLTACVKTIRCCFQKVRSSRENVRHRFDCLIRYSVSNKNTRREKARLFLYSVCLAWCEKRRAFSLHIDSFRFAVMCRNRR